MEQSQNENHGYVYILEVKDIDLPVCKIGRTSKTPSARCVEINRSSTGDFLWQVAHQFSVNDCKRFERLVHKKLGPFRQKGREFFNITAKVAHDAVVSILERQSEIRKLSAEEQKLLPIEAPKSRKAKATRRIEFRHRDSEYAEVLASFTRLIGCKGRPFGQLNKPYFGMSDGNEGVQWNIAVDTERNVIRLGVNLEGKKYTDWPIRTLLLNELKNPTFFKTRDRLANADHIFIAMTRDAWQVTARPSIIEKFIGPENGPLTEIHSALWQSMIQEALSCLSVERDYRGRAQQLVTLRNRPKTGNNPRIMEVSPHLTFWTSIASSDNTESHLRWGIDRLMPIYEWIVRTVGY